MSTIGQTNGSNGANGAGPIDVGAWAPPNPPGLVQQAPNPPNTDLRALERTVNRMLGNEDAMQRLIDKMKTPDNASFSNDRASIVRDVRKVERDLYEFTHARLEPNAGHHIRG